MTILWNVKISLSKSLYSEKKTEKLWSRNYLLFVKPEHFNEKNPSRQKIIFLKVLAREL